MTEKSLAELVDGEANKYFFLQSLILDAVYENDESIKSEVIGILSRNNDLSRFGIVSGYVRDDIVYVGIEEENVVNEYFVCEVPLEYRRKYKAKGFNINE